MTRQLLLWIILVAMFSRPVHCQNLTVSGGDLAWKVENEFFVVDFSKNSKTGRSGQINTVYLKNPINVLVTRGVESSTLHLSPNLARGAGWVGVNRWDPPQEWSVKMTEGVFSVLRKGPMPEVPEIYATCRYEIRKDSPWILVEEAMEATEDARVSLLRLDEWSVVPDERNPFTHLGWSGPSGQIVFAERKGNPSLPLQTDWVAFFSAEKGFGFASVRVDLSTSGPEGEAAPLVNESVRFSGEPHYYYRALIYPPGDIGEGDPDPLILVRQGTRYSIRYYLYFFQSGGRDVEALRPVAEFSKSVRDSAQ